VHVLRSKARSTILHSCKYSANGVMGKYKGHEK
jgi:hypothetical protein